MATPPPSEADDPIAGTAAPDDAPVSETTIAAPLSRVWATITDPRTFPLWLVGAQRIRAVDDSWPAPGSAFHHTVGLAPLRVRDRTEVVSLDPPRQIVLLAHLSILGSATVTFDLHETSPGHTRVSITEAPASGPLGRGWRFGGRTLLRLGLWGRNSQSLNRLEEGMENDVITPHTDPTDS